MSTRFEILITAEAEVIPASQVESSKSPEADEEEKEEES